MSKHILLMVSSMHAGGAERVAADLANAWATKGYQVTLLITFSGRGTCFYLLSEHVRVVFLSDEVRTQRSGALGYIGRFFALRRLITTLRPNVIVSFLTNVNVAALLSKIGIRIPTIVCERTYPPQFPAHTIWNQLRRWTYPVASRVAMQTTKGLDWLETEIPRARGVVLPNPIPYPLNIGSPCLSPSSYVLNSRKVLLAVGRMSEEKGHSDLLDAFASVTSVGSQWDLVIVGDGPLRTDLESQARALSIETRVFMPGQVGNVSEWYERADLYVLSSRVEGFPNTLGEAMAHGCAAVSFDCHTGPRDLIRHEVDGLLVPPGNLEALAQALGRLMHDDALRAQLAARALEVRSRYSMQRILSLWDALFAQVDLRKSPK